MQKPYEFNVRVYYEDTDVGGVVYHSNYLNFCERARSEIFFSKGEEPILGEYHFVAHTLSAKYLAPAKFADLLRITTEVTQIKAASLVMNQKVYRSSDDLKLFSMQITLACLKGTTLSKIPEEFSKIFQKR